MIKIKNLATLFFTFVILYAIYAYHVNYNKSKVVNLKKVLEISIRIAEMGGDQVRKVKQKHQLRQWSKGKTKEGINDPLTEGDIKSHETMVYGFKKVFPDVKVISEEHDNRKVNLEDVETPKHFLLKQFVDDDVFVNAEDITVWVDPLDATKEYTEDLLQYVTTMVCVAVKGKPMIGVIHQPFTKNTIWAWVGHSISPNLYVASKQERDKPVIIVSQSHAGKVKDVAVQAFGEGTEVISAGGAGYKTLQVIQGNATAYIHITLIKKWDVCAGNALLNAIGGRMTTLGGEELQYGAQDNVRNENGLLAAVYKHSIYLNKLQSVKQKYL
ncbi:putative inositol monophosphatase 3 [Centruroides vittatus]|uniref:putative inositol monophosphatase 3 n=1 Tax=Centruroides vittatus TaxID=120091 RepID=UPI00350F97FB